MTSVPAHEVPTTAPPEESGVRNYAHMYTKFLGGIDMISLVELAYNFPPVTIENNGGKYNLREMVLQMLMREAYA